MNIFKALSGGNGRISETNITSFMNYLLDSSNELNNSFFVLFVDLLDKGDVNSGLFEMLHVKGRTIRQKILSFSDNYIVTSEPEYLITNENGNKQIPDILIRIKKKQSEEDVVYFIIENKINKGAIKKHQIENQFRFFHNSEDYEKGKPIYSVLITPDENIFESLYEEGKALNENTKWLKWTNHTQPNISIEAIVRCLITYEHKAEIEPIDPNTQFILKSFVDYLATEFSERVNGKKNFSYKGFKEMDSAYAKLGDMEYYIKRFSNSMIRLFDSEENLIEGSIKPKLREINEHCNLGVDILHPNGNMKNTHILGREIINKLKRLD